MKLQIAAIGFIAALLGSLGGYVLTRAFGSSPPFRGGNNPAVLQELTQLQQGYRALVQRLDSLRDSVLEISNSSSARMSVTDPATGSDMPHDASNIDEIATRDDIRRLEGKLLNLIRQGALRSNAQPLDDRHGADWNSLARLTRLRDKNKGLARQRVLFMTVQEVVRNYGLPTSAGKDSLIYDNEEMRLLLIFRISNGYVVGLD